MALTCDNVVPATSLDFRKLLRRSVQIPGIGERVGGIGERFGEWMPVGRSPDLPSLKRTFDTRPVAVVGTVPGRFLSGWVTLTAAATVQNYGEVFTRRWVVDVLLDLTGYTADRDLANVHLLEPSCGSGAFLGPCR